MYRQYLGKLHEALEKTIITDNYCNHLENWEDAMESIVQEFLRIKREEKQCFFIGNGGSAGIAVHMTTDFVKNGGIKAQSLYSPSLVTCISNDFSYEDVFAKPLELFAKEGDLLVAISSSGNSANIVNALETAKSKGVVSITLSGFKADNKIRAKGKYNIYVPIEHYGIVESIHNILLQQIVDVIMERDGVGL